VKIWKFEIRLAGKETGRVGDITVPRQRVSEPDEKISFGALLGSADNYLSDVNPRIPFQILEIISKFCVSSPDFAQAVSNIVYLGNNGHKIQITADSNRRVDRALKRLNGTADRINVDNLINRMLRQMAVNGALSIEWVPKYNLSGIDTYALVPVRQIRFRYDKEKSRYVPRQYTSSGKYVELNEATYIYSALEQEENSPYGISPFVSALPNAVIQVYMMESMKFAIKKIGLMGVAEVIMKEPSQQPGETAETYKARLVNALTELSTNMAQNYRDGMAAHYSNIELKHYPVNTDARGAKEILQLNEEQIMSGLKQDPAMLGRSYSTTETYAGVVYSKMVNEIDNYRRHVQFAVEQGYRLDLMMAGIIVSSLVMDFTGNSSFRPKEQAETQKLTTETAVMRMDAGLISPDQAAQECGYEKAYHTEFEADTGGDKFADYSNNDLVGGRFEFRSGRYVFERERLEVKTEVPQRREVSAVEMANEKGIERRRLRWVGQYLNKIEAIDGKARAELTAEVKRMLRNGDFAASSPEEFADRIFTHVELRYPEALKGYGLKKTVRSAVYSIYLYYRTRDNIIRKGRIPGRLTLPDKRAVKFIQGLDDFYFSKFLQNDSAKGPMLRFLQREYLEGGFTDIDSFAKKFGKAFGDISKPQMKRIVDTSVSRIRNWGHVRQLAEFKITTMEIVEVMDRLTCPTCAEMDGKLFQVKAADRKVQELSELSAEEFDEKVYKGAPEDWRNNPVEYARSRTTDQMIADNIVGPPFHPRCRGRLVSR
jgi:hypothetical protein